MDKYKRLKRIGLFIVTALVMGQMGDIRAQVQLTFPSWTCSVDNIAATLTECQRVPKPDERYYITDIVAQSTTATAGQFLLQYGTGTNCGTGTTSLLPSSASVVRLAAPANTAAPLVIMFRTPLPVPAGKAICLLGVATNTVTAQISGTVGP